METQGKLVFSLEAASLGYRDLVVLQDFNWQVRKGERWAIVGPNGAGKTTLVKTLLGLLPLRDGALNYYDDQGHATSIPISIGYLPQINHVDRAFPISVLEVIDSGLYGLALNKSARSVRIYELLEQIGLEAYSKSPIGTLSGGQLQRVLLARALASRPSLIVLDEPMSFLDKTYKEGFESLLNRLTTLSSTILMVTHDLPEHKLENWKILPLGQW